MKDPKYVLFDQMLGELFIALGVKDTLEIVKRRADLIAEQGFGTESWAKNQSKLARKVAEDLFGEEDVRIWLGEKAVVEPEAQMPEEPTAELPEELEPKDEEPAPEQEAIVEEEKPKAKRRSRSKKAEGAEAVA